MPRISRSFFVLALFVLLSAGGFFVSRINALNASGNILTYHNGNLASSTAWSCVNCEQGAPNGDNYIIMTKVTSTLLSAPISIDGFQDLKLTYRARTYGGVSGASPQITLSASLDFGVSWLVVSSSTPIDSVMRDQSAVDFSVYSGMILIKFETASATGSKGAGLDEIKLTGAIDNQQPLAIATSSLSEADVGEEIFFDGRNSVDDGQIINWYWDFGNGHFAYASTTGYAYQLAGNYDVYLSVTDDSGLGATSSPLSVVIHDQPAATTTATSTVITIKLNDLLINEVYPVPLTADVEWIEIYNPTTSTFDLAGLMLLNLDGGKFVTTTLTGLIQPGGYLVIEDIEGSLNNSGDTIVLRTAEAIISQTVYPAFSEAMKGMSWARAGAGDYALTMTPTPNSANVITPRPSASSGGSGGGGYSVIVSTEIATTTVATIATSTAINYEGLIVINEIYPNPFSDAEDEFIELLNISTTTIDLAGLLVGDNSKSIYRIKSSSTNASASILKPGGFFVISSKTSHLALNNSGLEYVRLYSPDSALIDQVEYLGENIKGLSYSRTADAKWQWVKTPTPAMVNAGDELYPESVNPALLDDSAKIKLTGTVKKTGKITKPVQDVSLAGLKELLATDLARVRGVVAVLPGVLASQYFYITDNASGAQIYSYKKDFPNLQIGDYIEVIGELSDSSAGRRVKITDQSQIKIIERRNIPEAHSIAGLDVGEEYEGSLVRINGTVLETQSRNIIVDDGNSEVKVYINSRIELKDIGAKPGDKLAVIGIVGRTASGYRLMPRDLQDIAVEQGQVKGEYVASSAEKPANTVTNYLIAFIVFLCLVIALMYSRFRKI